MLPKDVQSQYRLCNCPFWANPNQHIVLVCYEKPADFCHRHLVADWMKQHGIQMEEWLG